MTGARSPAWQPGLGLSLPPPPPSAPARGPSSPTRGAVRLGPSFNICAVFSPAGRCPPGSALSHRLPLGAWRGPRAPRSLLPAATWSASSLLPRLDQVGPSVVPEPLWCSRVSSLGSSLGAFLRQKGRPLTRWCLWVRRRGQLEAGREEGGVSEQVAAGFRGRQGQLPHCRGPQERTRGCTRLPSWPHPAVHPRTGPTRDPSAAAARALTPGALFSAAT